MTFLCVFTVQSEETLDHDSHHSDDEIPTMARRPLLRGRARKRAIAVDDRDAGVFASFQLFSRMLLIYFNIYVCPEYECTCFCVVFSTDCLLVL